MKYYVIVLAIVLIGTRTDTFRHRLLRSMQCEVAEVASLALSGNAKRKQSCQRVGGEKKRVGHRREDDFKAQYNPVSMHEKTEYAATSDTWLAASSHIAGKLRDKFGFASRDLYVSNKSGNNIQLTLGNIPELAGEDNLGWIENKTNSTALFNKYLKKSESVRPADVLVYKDTACNNWLFFKMDDVVSFIVENAKWRKLETGRIKGDFEDGSKKGTTQYATYEYRSTHKSHFLGFNGGKGSEFIRLLKDKIAYYEDQVKVKEKQD